MKKLNMVNIFAFVRNLIKRNSKKEDAPQELFLDTADERMAHYVKLRKENPGLHINPHMDAPLFERLGLPSGTMWQEVHPKASYYPKDDSMLPTIAQAKELIASCHIEVSEDGVVLKSRYNGKFVEFDSDIYSDEESRKVCMLWLKDPVAENPEWGYALIIGHAGVSFQTFPKSEKLYIYLVKIRQSDVTLKLE